MVIAERIAHPQLPNEVTGEDLKTRLVNVNVDRAKDALHGVGKSAEHIMAQEITVGPFNGELSSGEVKNFLSSDEITVYACGRDEAKRGNLSPTLDYALKSTQNAGNVRFCDANSSDNSVALAQSKGIDTIRRSDIWPEAIDVKRMSKILALPETVVAGKEMSGYPPLRKGIDITVARISMLRDMLKKKGTSYAAFIDTDLKSIPGGAVAGMLEQDDLEKIYIPLELSAAGLLALNSRTDQNMWAVFTGSEHRNNETIFGVFNAIASKAGHLWLDDQQRSIAKVLGMYPGFITHPLTGELIVSTLTELQAMGATGQCVEVARLLSLAGGHVEKYGLPNSGNLETNHSLIGNALRGKQQRIDEPQPDEKEWWMIGSVLPAFIQTVSDYAIAVRKLPHQFNLDDYELLNRSFNQRASGIGSRLNNVTQRREVDEYPMERVIPPVALLYKEGIIKI